jgi:hypothetical protein
MSDVNDASFGESIMKVSNNKKDRVKRATAVNSTNTLS